MVCCIICPAWLCCPEEAEKAAEVGRPLPPPMPLVLAGGDPLNGAGPQVKEAVRDKAKQLAKSASKKKSV
jgi:hypothetical protein